MNGKRRRRRVVGKSIFTHIILSGASLVALFPFFWIITTSFKEKRDALAMPPTWLCRPTLKNYSSVLQGEFFHSLLNSAIISTSVTLLVIVVGSLAAYSFSRFEIKGKDHFFFFVLTTRMGPPVAFALPLYLMMLKLRLIDTHWALILTYLSMNLAFGIWMMKGFFDGIPRSLEEAAMIDGCSTMQAIFRIILPLSRSGIFATGAFSFILTWNEFFYAMVLTRSSARTFPVLLPTYMGVIYPRWEQMCSASVVLSVPVLVITLVISVCRESLLVLTSVSLVWTKVSRQSSTKSHA